MNKQPLWVPDWVWTEYTGCKTRERRLVFYPPGGNEDRRGEDVGYFAAPDRRLEIMEKLLESEECGSVWRAMEARRGLTLESYSRVILNKGLTFENFDEFDALCANKHSFESLSDLICEALDGPKGTSALTKSQRRKKAQKIASLSVQLKDAVRDAFWDDYPNIAFALLMLFAQTETIQVEPTEEGRLKFTPNDKVPESAKQILTEDGNFAEGLMLFPVILDLLPIACETWGEDKPILPKPNDPRANRLFFIRMISNWFEEYYDSGLRAQTLALTSVFFDCDDLDPSVISKLAPGSKNAD